MRASGIPTNSTACCVAIASGNASGSARPTSSLAKMTMRRAMKRKSSPGVQHFREPVDRAFFVGSAHAFDERADRVVVRVADAIVDDGLLLDAFLRDREREMNRRATSSLALPRRTADGCALGGVVRTPISSAFRHLRASPSLNFARCRRASVIHLHVVISETALFIGKRAIDQLLELLHA